jgi:aminopeptidase N
MWLNVAQDEMLVNRLVEYFKKLRKTQTKPIQGRAFSLVELVLRWVERMVIRRGLVGVVLVCGCAGARVEAQRLPGGVVPLHYGLRLEPDLATATFSGSETIEVVLAAPASSITMNAAEIQFDSAQAYVVPEGITVWGLNRKGAQLPIYLEDLGSPDIGGSTQTAEVTLDPAKEQATLHFARPLPAGRVVLAIAFRGILNDKLRGFYLSKTKTRRYAVTQFEATDARRAFPCFDEPALKATFAISLVIDRGDTGISNTKMVSDKPGPDDGKHTVVFAVTPKMSTYLVAFLVGDFVCTRGKADGVRIRACATPDKVALTRFSLDAAKFMLRYYDRYFDIEYPLPKLDMVAVPDFEAGAMENLGCITYRETEMLVDAKDGPIPAKMEVAETVAHEIAHQWFGDLVTPVWWDNLWLNEGFATWMESKAAEKWHPEWPYAQSVAVDKNGILDEDSGRTTRAIRAQADTPPEINAMFDDIAYGKAGAVISMVENWVDEETFRKGVQSYLAAHLYTTATAADFWTAQTRISGLPVDKMMQGFVEQPGVPLVTIGEAGGSVPVAQRRFTLAGSPTPPGEAWMIPVCFAGAGCQVMMPATRRMHVSESKTATGAPFVYANAGDKGYYRTVYAEPALRAIAANAEAGLTPPERIGLLGNQWALMRAGQGNVGEFLDLMLALKQDPNEMVQESALGKVAAIDSLIASEPDRARLDAVVLREFAPIYAALDPPGKHEKFDHAQLRAVLFAELGRAGDPKILAEAQNITTELFSGSKKDRRPVDPAIADAAVELAVAKGDAERYDMLLRVVQNATDPDLKEDALRTLTRFEAPILVIRTLEYALSDEVRSQDSWSLIALLLERRETQDLAWEFVQQHWAAVVRKSTASSGMHIVEATSAFCTVEKRDEVASFFAEHPVESSQRALAKSIDGINDCIALRAAQQPNLREWLDAQGAR